MHTYRGSISIAYHALKNPLTTHLFLEGQTSVESPCSQCRISVDLILPFCANPLLNRTKIVE